MLETETKRLSTLKAYEVLDTPPEPVFDNLVKVAARTFSVPVAFVSLIDSDRQWFKACNIVPSMRAMPRRVAFCDFTIQSDAVFVVPDASLDERFRDNPLVRGEPNIRFYAGAPLRTPDGVRIGTLCILDSRPRYDFDQTCSEMLNTLAEAVMSAMNLRGEIDERRRRQARLAKEAKRTRALASELRTVIDTVVDGVMIINSMGMIDAVNPACVNMFGYSAGELVGQNVNILMREILFGEHSHNYYDKNVTKIIGVGAEVIGLHRDGSEFPMELSIGEMRSGRRRRFVAVVRDITARIEAEQMKAEFLATVSHELRTPLTSIIGSLGLLKMGAAGLLSPIALNLTSIAHNNSERLLRLINDLLNLEKIELEKFEFCIEPVDFPSFIERALKENEGFAQEYGVTLSFSSSIPEVEVAVDADRLAQVMSNLISNAVKFSDKGAVVEIAAELVGPMVRISVSDHGPGIPPAFHDRIFGKFSQADSSDTRKRGGTGLGLAICKSLVERMGGQIDFRTAPGEGTCLFFEFPFASDARASDKVRRAASG